VWVTSETDPAARDPPYPDGDLAPLAQREPMASVEKRVRDGAATWLARWRDPDGRQRKRTFARKLDADRFLVSIEADRLRGSYVDPADRTTVTEYARQWIAARPHRPSTAARHRHIVETHVAPTRLGSLRLVAVRPSDVRAWATDRAAVLAPSTLRLVVSLVRSILAGALLDRRITSSPVVRIALPRDGGEPVVPLTVAQVRELANAVPRRNRAMVVAQAGLGLRVGELLGLRVHDIDFLRRAVTVRWQITRLGGRERTDTKTPQSRRTIPLPQVVGDASPRI
jgi:integrase